VVEPETFTVPSKAPFDEPPQPERHIERTVMTATAMIALIEHVRVRPAALFPFIKRIKPLRAARLVTARLTPV
jgi:hypothetical protein